MAFQLDNLTYPNVVDFYDGDKQERGGILTTSYGDGEHSSSSYFGVTYLQDIETFILDTTDTSIGNRNEITLFKWSNGVELRLSYYSEDETIGWGNIYYYDKDGNQISGIGGDTLRLYPSSENPFGSAYQIYFTPSSINYADNPPNESHPNSFTNATIYMVKDNPSPYPTPDLDGWFQSNNLITYYFATSSNALIGQDAIDDFFDKIVKGGDGTPISPILPSDDTSEPGGGDDDKPDYNPFSDPIGFPDLPISGDSINTGFIRIYNPSSTQLRNLANVLWSDDFVNTIKKIQNDPMEAVISLHSVPFQLHAGTAECRIGNFNTGIMMPALTQQFYTIDMGSIHIPEHWASALDYSPYVTIDCYLPFVGVVPMLVDDIVSKTLSIKYNIDVLSGATVVSIMCGDSVLYTYNTNCILSHPISQSSYGPRYQAILGAIGNTIAGASQGGIGGAVGGAVGSGINVALSKQSSVMRGGTIGGATGVLGNFTPYLIIHRPIQSLASGFAHFKGYPSNISGTIGSVSGYTEVESVHLTGIACTDTERDEISALLYNGVIV